MKIICVALLALLVFSCSNTTVHLYSRYLSESEVKEISLKLKKLKFEVQTNELLFPKKIKTSSLLYPISSLEQHELDSMLDSLSQLGWDIPNVDLLLHGNHKFTQDNIGLFLMPEGININEQVVHQDLVNSYESTECDTKAKIQLNQDNTYKLTISNNTEYVDKYGSGNWIMRGYPYIEFTSKNKRWLFFLEIEELTETDKVSKISILKLKPASDYWFLPNCNFVYGVRV